MIADVCFLSTQEVGGPRRLKPATAALVGGDKAGREGGGVEGEREGEVMDEDRYLKGIIESNDHQERLGSSEEEDGGNRRGEVMESVTSSSRCVWGL